MRICVYAVLAQLPDSSDGTSCQLAFVHALRSHVHVLPTYKQCPRPLTLLLVTT